MWAQSVHDLSIKTSMQFIQGDNRHETYFSTLIGQECNDYAVNFKDVFQFFLLLTRINYQVVISFNDAVKIYLPEVDTCIGTCRRRRWPHDYGNICSEGKTGVHAASKSYNWNLQLQHPQATKHYPHILEIVFIVLIQQFVFVLQLIKILELFLLLI